MLAQAVREWYGERGAVLKLEAFDMIRRLESRDELFNAKAVLQMAVAFEQTVAAFDGTLKAIPSADKITLAQQIWAESERAFDADAPASYGTALFGILLEAGETPGEDAAASFQVLWDMLKAAVSLKHALDKAASAV